MRVELRCWRVGFDALGELAQPCATAMQGGFDLRNCCVEKFGDVG